MDGRAARGSGRRRVDTGDRAASGRLLPLEADVMSTPVGWTVRLPVRMESVSVEKRTVLLDQVRVLRREYVETERIEETVRAERLTTEVVETEPGRHDLETRTYPGGLSPKCEAPRP